MMLVNPNCGDSVLFSSHLSSICSRSRQYPTFDFGSFFFTKTLSNPTARPVRETSQRKKGMLTPGWFVCLLVAFSKACHSKEQNDSLQWVPEKRGFELKTEYDT
jgi:hypothetical protein